MDDRIKQTIEKLKAIDLVGDSHENLSAICSVLYGGKPEYGWTIGACSTLRDVLVGWLSEYDPTDWANSYLAEQGLMRLPKDADGEVIRVGDEMCDDVISAYFKSDERLTVCGFTYNRDGDHRWQWQDEYDDWHECESWRRYRKPTIEDMLREFGDEVRICCDTENTIAEYAAKLREVMADE